MSGPTNKNGAVKLLRGLEDGRMTASEGVFLARDLDPGMPSLRVVAYNFLVGGGRKRTGHWSRVIRELGADLLLAQECRLPEDCPGERFRPNPDDGLRISGKGSEGGMGIVYVAERQNPAAGSL